MIINQLSQLEVTWVSIPGTNDSSNPEVLKLLMLLAEKKAVFLDCFILVVLDCPTLIPQTATVSSDCTDEDTIFSQCWICVPSAAQLS